MRWLVLYLRSRRAPLAVAMAVGCAVLMWSMWVAASDSREVGPAMVVLTVLLMVTALTPTLVSPDAALDRTAALPWPPRRAAHVLAAMTIVVGLLAITLVTPARFSPALLVVRDAAGLLGLTALCATVISPARSWFVPLGWTLAATLYSQSETRLGQVLTWQGQDPRCGPAAVTALVLAVGGLAAYTLAGPPRRAVAEAAV
ncbi:hypothetical protein Acy02nite_48370 [Actinoplanes cyaneus]|uniref:Uncharacterized protein n=1 Tax=Actinoplanes cyaneus TaxID=52696 RepID=A0A919ILR1_9ACTN|nr:hypothetical protein [Actinoplanes cyaneus]MCW2138719.1 hypothetical protein [Actinoplanes cyaneus]GID66956.1 hypothetical protein Acy02nite_48370 [Actinoplanes cyaneus]